jgi:hypothetical protein
MLYSLRKYVLLFFRHFGNYLNRAIRLLFSKKRKLSVSKLETGENTFENKFSLDSILIKMATKNVFFIKIEKHIIPILRNEDSLSVRIPIIKNQTAVKLKFIGLLNRKTIVIPIINNKIEVNHQLIHESKKQIKLLKNNTINSSFENSKPRIKTLEIKQTIKKVSLQEMKINPNSLKMNLKESVPMLETEYMQELEKQLKNNIIL